ncbi:MAG: putative signal transduction protein [Verrucomicrobia bacterium]|nr:putative signal transduction protein [Verrucomicrobiota bacterium]
MIAASVSRDTLLLVVKVLPTAPQILAHLGQLLLDINSGLSEVTELLRRDAGLTARIIRVANSSVYAKGAPASSLVEALARVGFKEVYRLTGFAAVAQMSDQKLLLYGISGARLRENSLLAALVMEALAPAAGIDARMAYTAGLLRSTGKIALDRLVREDTSCPVLPADVADVSEWELKIVGMTNCAAAAFILGEWRFPGEMIAGIRDHYHPDESANVLAHLLHIASGVADTARFGCVGEAGYWDLSPARLEAAHVTDSDVRAARLQALESFEALRAVVA